MVKTERLNIAFQIMLTTLILLVLIISIIGGRIIPLFTSNTTNFPKKAPLRLLEVTSISSILFLTTFTFVGFHEFPPELVFLVSLTAALSHALRLAG
jgi:uncharacterized protein involved in response to NO